MADYAGIPGKTGQRAKWCRSLFLDCLKLLNFPTERDAQHDKLMESVRNSLDRFEIWIISIREMYKTDLDEGHDSREQPIQSDFRGDLCNEVLRLLDRLQRILGDLMQILNGTRQQRTWIKSSISVPPSDMDISSSEESDSEFANYLKQNPFKEDSADSQTVTESGELCQSIRDIITSLMRIAMQVDNSSLNSKFDLCQLQESDSVEPEITRMRDKLPLVRRNEPLARKLGRANAQRRKWLESRRQDCEDRRRVRSLIPQVPSNLPYETPVRCPYCYAIVVMSNYDEWQRHVFADLSSYICTFEGCPAPLFETRQQWFQHEMEVHRKCWRCDMCEESYHSSWDMKRHLTQKHSNIIGAGNAEAHAERLGRPPQKIRAKDCPLCDPSSNLQQRSTSMIRDWEMTAEAFGDHLGKHLEDISLLALPLTTDIASVFRGTGDISNLTAPIGERRCQPARIIDVLKMFWGQTYLTCIMALFLVLRSQISFLVPTLEEDWLSISQICALCLRVITSVWAVYLLRWHVERNSKFFAAQVLAMMEIAIATTMNATTNLEIIVAYSCFVAANTAVLYLFGPAIPGNAN